MNYVDNEAWQQLRGWIAEQGFTIFGTIKFTDGTIARDTRGEKIVCAYFNALDRAYFGNAGDNVGMRHKGVSIFIRRQLRAACDVAFVSSNL